MRILAATGTLAGLGAMLAACATTPTAEAGSTYYLREGMVNAINPPIMAIWDMQVEVMDDFGNFDPALMDEGKWTALVGHARELERQAQQMANAETYVVADPMGDLTEPPEGTDLAAIQQRLDTNTAAYRAMSQNLERHVSQLVAAAQARDAETVTNLVNETQPVCKACHDVFWYPEEY